MGFEIKQLASEYGALRAGVLALWMEACLPDDVVDFTRTNLGIGISIARCEVDLGALCAEDAEQMHASHPGRPVELSVSGDCRGSWDGTRMQQLLSNLVVNAIHYGGTTNRCESR